ncbi:hypothetical protein MUK42_34291 [Musa troglodytarum]|uniref:Large ribosomal subunit protein bL20c n=1 Tax=Musa troglodytarum TaxID=320322 RepID=A0A9E7KJP9_9LILI|nr:hypothetical protein MUK42_34291 [Musa troglodytarum]
MRTPPRARARARARVHPPPARPPPLTPTALPPHRPKPPQAGLLLICIKLIRVMGVQLYKLEIGNRKPEIGVLYSYSRLIHDLYKKQLLLNRKILAQIAILNKNCLYMISNKIIK